MATETNSPIWFQLYVMRDRGFMRILMQGAETVRCRTLVVPLDLQVQGQRNRDLKNGMAVPPRFSLGICLGVAAKPKWWAQMALTKRRTFGKLVGRAKGLENMSTLVEWVNKNFDQTLTRDDLEEVWAMWPKKFVLKGIIKRDDPLRATDAAMICCAFTYGLGAFGAAGVTRTLELIQRELELSMAFCSVTENSAISKVVIM